MKKHAGLPDSDAMVERVYDMVNRQPSERARLEVARAAALAAEYRAQQLAKKERHGSKTKAYY